MTRKTLISLVVAAAVMGGLNSLALAGDAVVLTDTETEYAVSRTLPDGTEQRLEITPSIGRQRFEAQSQSHRLTFAR